MKSWYIHAFHTKLSHLTLYTVLKWNANGSLLYLYQREEWMVYGNYYFIMYCVQYLVNVKKNITRDRWTCSNRRLIGTKEKNTNSLRLVLFFNDRYVSDISNVHGILTLLEQRITITLNWAPERKQKRRGELKYKKGGGSVLICTDLETLLLKRYW